MMRALGPPGPGAFSFHCFIPRNHVLQRFSIPTSQTLYSNREAEVGTTSNVAIGAIKKRDPAHKHVVDFRESWFQPAVVDDVAAATADEVRIGPPSNEATTARVSTGANPNNTELQCVGIGISPIRR